MKDIFDTPMKLNLTREQYHEIFDILRKDVDGKVRRGAFRQALDYAEESIDALEAKEQEISRLNCVHTAARVTIDGLNAIIKDQNEQLTAAVEDIGKYAHNVHTCVSGKSEDCHVKDDHEWCAKCPSWQWRGRKEQNDG